MELTKHPSSFRDPSGFVFSFDGIFYRQVNKSFAGEIEAFYQSGLYQSLINLHLLLSHHEVNENFWGQTEWHSTLLPEQLKYLSYPFEWSFDMLKDAALATLEAAQEAIKFKMILKDASAFNIQLHNGAMTLIDSLSFERYDEKSPWIAYRQFCEHFLSPLVCMHYLKVSLHKYLFANIDGLPLALTKAMLPPKSKMNLNVLLHLHLHARISGRQNNIRSQTAFGTTKLKQLYRSLEETVKFCKLSLRATAWSGYHQEVIQREEYIENKKKIVSEWVSMLPVTKAVDIGANDGMFSELLANQNIYTVAVDNDPEAVNNLYKKVKNSRSKLIHPLLINLDNPTPGFGFGHEERMSFVHRTKVDLVLALAIIHHLAIAKNVPFDLISKFLSRLGKILIIEFVPKEDPKINMMLQGRRDIFTNYDENHFLDAFSSKYKIIKSAEIGSSKRKLFLMEIK